MVFDLVIKNAKLILPDKIVKGSLVVEDGRIKNIVKDTSAPEADKVIDAKENYVLPGLIDAHVHFREPGASSKEDWVTGSSAAASGGITTVLDMPNTQPPTTTIERLNEKRDIVAPKSHIDYGFHFGATTDNLDELMKLVKNVASVKFYMSTTTGSLMINNDEIIFEEFKVLGEKNIPATIHAEKEDMIQRKLGKLKEAEQADAFSYSEARSNIIAAVATNDIIYLSKMAENQLHICHLTTREELDILKNVKDKQRVTAEATPHHLFLNKEDIRKEGLNNYGKVNPPLRSKEDQEALWNAITEGLIDIIASDHAPHLRESKAGDMWTASSGIPGVETTLPLLLDQVNKGKIRIRRVVELMAEKPAEIFGIKNKGKIEKGYDADLVIVDMKKKKEIRDDRLFTKCGWSPFNGRKLGGWPIKTFVRGNLVFDEGKIIKNKGVEVGYTN